MRRSLVIGRTRGDVRSVRTRAAVARSLLFAAAAVLCGNPVAGQIAFGSHAEWGDDSGFGIGARLIIDLRPLIGGLEAAGSFDYFFPDDRAGAELKRREINANVTWGFGHGGAITPYAGLGLNVARFEASTRVLDATVSADETEKALNLVGGLIINTGWLSPYLEGRVATRRAREFVAVAGIRFPRRD